MALGLVRTTHRDDGGDVVKVSMKDISAVRRAIKAKPGLRTSQLVEMLGLPRERVEDAIWELWSSGQIQMEPDSTLRLTRDGEKVFRHFAP
jgi:Mn-dependent DtxR family transcriptional regulator